MGFYPFLPQTLPLSGGTLTGVLNSAAIANTGTITSTGNISTSGVAAMVAPGGFDANLAGAGIRVAEGSNAKQGTAALTAGTVVVANTAVTANSRIFLTGQVLGGTAGGLNVTTRTAGTSFTVTSTNAADTSTFAYEIFEPG